VSVPPCGYELDLKRERLRQLFGLRSKGNTTVTLPHGLTPIVGQGSTTCRVVFMMKRLYKARRALLVEGERERSPLLEECFFDVRHLERVVAVGAVFTVDDDVIGRARFDVGGI